MCKGTFVVSSVGVNNMASGMNGLMGKYKFVTFVHLNILVIIGNSILVLVVCFLLLGISVLRTD